MSSTISCSNCGPAKEGKISRAPDSTTGWTLVYAKAIGDRAEGRHVFMAVLQCQEETADMEVNFHLKKATVLTTPLELWSKLLNIDVTLCAEALDIARTSHLSKCALHSAMGVGMGD